MKKSKYLAQGDFIYRHTPVPIFVKASGAVMKDDEGYKYFCAEAANGTTSLGFDQTILNKAITKIKDLPSIPSFCETSIRLKLSDRLGKLIHDNTGLDGKIAFDLGGAQGIELALRIAKANNKKSQFVVFEGGYHGRSIYTAQFSASHRYRKAMGEWRIPVTRLPYPDYEQSGSSLSKEEWKDNYLQYIKSMTTKEVGGIFTKAEDKDIVALVIEPVLNAGGIVKPDKDLLEEVVKIFKGLGALIIVDEVFCGFHRTGPMFGFQHYDFKPDIIVMSKAISNGITPLSCVWAKDPLLSIENFPPGSHSATFINQPLGLAIADTVLDQYENWTNKNKDIKNLEQALDSMIQEVVESSKHTVSGFAIGGVGRILLKKPNAGEFLDLGRKIAWEEPINGVHGLILASTGMAPNVIAMNPPLKLSNKDVDTMRQLLLKTFKEAEKVIS